MNTGPFAGDWGRWIAVIGIEVLVLAAVLTVTQRRHGTAVWRRMLWRTGLVGVLLITGGELLGSRLWVSQFLEGPAHSTAGVAEVRTDLKPTLAMPIEPVTPTGRRKTVPVEVKPESPSAVWWPAWIWLTGAVGLLARMSFARIVFGVALSRGGRILDETIQLRAARLAQVLGIRRRVRLRSLSSLPGPVACGVLFPSIALPTKFAEENTPVAQDAMVAHELAHIAARDAFWHGVADLAVAVLWWHPVVWWMRRRMLAASELAADEACLVVEDGPRVLAECLVTLARRWVSSPLGAGWQGILGGRFRSALGQRVERLLGIETSGVRPLLAWQRWVGRVGALVLLGGIATVGALVLPGDVEHGSLGRLLLAQVFAAEPEGPSATPAPSDRIDWKPWSREAVEAARDSGRPVLVFFTADWSRTGKVNEQVALEVPEVRQRLRELQAVALRGDATYATNPAMEAELKVYNRLPATLVYFGGVRTLLSEVLTPEIVLEALSGPKAESVSTPNRPKGPDEPNGSTPGSAKSVTSTLFEARALYQAGSLAEAREKLQAVLREDPKSKAAQHYLSLIETKRVEQARAADKPATLDARLDAIGLEAFGGTMLLSAMVEKLAREIRAADPDRKGINFIISSNSGVTGMPDAKDVLIQIEPPLRRPSVRQVLDAIVQGGGGLIQFHVLEYAVVFSPFPPSDPEPLSLFTRWFQIDPERVGRALVERLGTNATPSLIVNLRTYFRALGIRFELVPTSEGSPRGRQLYFGQRPPRLMVRVTQPELDIIEATLQELNTPPPQVLIEARFVEMSDEAFSKLGFDWMMVRRPTNAAPELFGLPTNPSPTVASPTAAGGVAGVLTDRQSEIVIRALQKQRGVNLLSVPKVTTLSGRQAQIKVVEIRPVVTHLEPPRGQAGAQPVTTTLETGPVLDVVPYVMSDGTTIRMTIEAGVKEFLGYDSEASLKSPRPVYRHRSIVTSAVIGDGQTAVLCDGDDRLEILHGKGAVSKADVSAIGRKLRARHAEAMRETRLIVLVTARIIDGAGQRVHRDNEIPPGVPPQDAK